MKSRTSLVLAAIVCVALPHPAVGQQPSDQPPAPAITTLMVDVTISRFQDGKRLSSVPYTIAVLPDGRPANLRVGGEIAIPTTSIVPATPESPAKPARSFNYRNIGTNIDVSATPSPNGRYRISIALEETSVYPPDAAKDDIMSAPAVRATGAPAFRSLRTSNTVSLKDGQTIEFTAATDRISGEVARISVKLTVVP